MKYIILFISILFPVCIYAQSPIIWDDQMSIASAASGNDHPRIVTDAAGNPLVLWYNAERAMFSRWNGEAFETPVILNPVSMTVAGATWMGPDIAAHGDTIYVVFKETPEHEGHIWSIYSFDGGMTFSDPVQVDSSGVHPGRFPTVTTDAVGNPLVAFMKFNDAFGEARWVVTKSEDYGISYLPDVLASGWSSPTSNVCDCCPGAIINSGNMVAMLYRDNNSNIRDTWAGFSSDGGNTFTEGFNVDQQNWMIMACPSSGPDGHVIRDTLYSTFMNAASGRSRVYLSKTSLSDIAPSTGVTVTQNNPDITLQNFPRISGDGNALGIVWKQIISGEPELVMRFTGDITNGLPAAYDTVTLDNAANADIAISDGKIFIVWEDINTGTVKFRSGTYSEITGVRDNFPAEDILIYPNPSASAWTLLGNALKVGTLVELYDINGRPLFLKKITTDVVKNNMFEIDNSGLQSGIYYLRLVNDLGDSSRKLVKM